MAARRSTTSGRGAKQHTRGKLAPRAKNRGLGAAEVALALDEGEVAAVAAQVRAAGGTPIGAYRDPLGAQLLTLGLMYEKNARFGGGAYHPFLKKVDRFSARTLAVSLRERAGYAARLTEIETQVKRLVAQPQKRGFKSPYLRQYVIARINPVRFHKQKKGESGPAMPIAQALTRMLGAARSFKLESVSNSDLAWVALGAES